MPYQPQYLSGWMPSHILPLAEAWPIGRDIIYQHERGACDNEVPGDTSRLASARRFDLTFKHVLLPVWVASYRYHNKTFRFMINGQTGRVEGEKPISWIKVTIAVVIAIAVIGLLIYLFTRADMQSSGQWPVWEAWATQYLSAPDVPLLI
jgi:hypothetical protein